MPGGRPTKRDDETESKILEAVRAGNYMETAARYAGIAVSTLYDWQARFPEFSDAIQRARAEAEARNVAIIQRAAPTQWQAAGWWLERSFPQRYGRRIEVEHSDAPPIDPSVYTREELETLKALLQKGRTAEAVAPPRLQLAAGE